MTGLASVGLMSVTRRSTPRHVTVSGPATLLFSSSSPTPSTVSTIEYMSHAAGVAFVMPVKVTFVHVPGSSRFTVCWWSPQSPTSGAAAQSSKRSTLKDAAAPAPMFSTLTTTSIEAPASGVAEGVGVIERILRSGCVTPPQMTVTGPEMLLLSSVSVTFNPPSTVAYMFHVTGVAFIMLSNVTTLLAPAAREATVF